mmetsp:Transcript_2602/g.4434  ORF Transcript_2602/g.4434 Transcript_2602/m.4434 type:complete len:82 (-) Transcript_2602:41-286(-)
MRSSPLCVSSTTPTISTSRSSIIMHQTPSTSFIHPILSLDRNSSHSNCLGILPHLCGSQSQFIIGGWVQCARHLLEEMHVT